jgi:hypothetical protein
MGNFSILESRKFFWMGKYSILESREFLWMGKSSILESREFTGWDPCSVQEACGNTETLAVAVPCREMLSVAIAAARPDLPMRPHAQFLAHSTPHLSC